MPIQLLLSFTRNQSFRSAFLNQLAGIYDTELAAGIERDAKGKIGEIAIENCKRQVDAYMDAWKAQIKDSDWPEFAELIKRFGETFFAKRGYLRMVLTGKPWRE